MKKLVGLTLAVLVLGGAVPARSQTGGGPTVSGLVTAGGVPQGGVGVTLESVGEPVFPFPPSATTAADGTFTVTGAPPGKYLVRFDNRFDEYSDEYFPDAFRAADAGRITVTATSAIAGIDADLDPFGSLAGVVTNNGEPVNDMQVGVKFGWNEWEYSRTASDGTYSFNGLSAGEYIVCFNDSAEYLDECHEDRPYHLWESSDRVYVIPAAETTLTTAVGRGGVITGTALGWDGSVVSPVDFRLYRISDPPQEFHIFCCSGWPNYTLRGLPPGDYILRFTVHAAGYGDEWSGNADNRAEAMVIHVAEGETISGVDATLDPTGSVAGRVLWPTGAPAANVWVFALQPGGARGSLVPRTRTDADGRYQIDGLRVGTRYGIWFDPTLTSPNLAPEWQGDAPTQATADPVLVEQGMTTTVDAQLGWGGLITGRVTRGGAPLANVTVRPHGYAPGVEAWSLDFPVTTVRTDANGVYVLRGMPPGAVKLEFSVSGLTGPEIVWYKHKPDEASATPVRVRAAQVTPNINERFPVRVGT